MGMFLSPPCLIIHPPLLHKRTTLLHNIPIPLAIHLWEAEERRGDLSGYYTVHLNTKTKIDFKFNNKHSPPGRPLNCSPRSVPLQPEEQQRGMLPDLEFRIGDRLINRKASGK